MNVTQKTILFWLVSLIVLVSLVGLLDGILLPFVVSLVLAYFLDPVVEWGERKGLSRTLSVTCLIILVLLLMLAMLAITIPVLKSQITLFAGEIPAYVQRLKAYILPLLAKVQTIFPDLDMQSVRDSSVEYIGSGLKIMSGIITGLFDSSVAIINVLSLFIITPVVCFYLLRDWTKVKGFFKGVVPLYAVKTVNEQVSAINVILSGFIRGQTSVCLCLALYYSVALTLAGLNVGAIVGLLTGLLSFVPYVGCLLGFSLSMLLGLAQFPSVFDLLWILLVFGVGQILEGYVLTPKLVGDKTGLHPVWIIFAILAGGYLLGFIGVLIAVPTAAVIGVLVRFSLTKYRESPFYKGTTKSLPKSLPVTKAKKK